MLKREQRINEKGWMIKKKSLKRKSDSILKVLGKHNKWNGWQDGFDVLGKNVEVWQAFKSLWNRTEIEVRKINFMILDIYVFIYFRASSH